MIDQKPWYQSKAVWGAIAALLASLARATGHDPGLDAAQQLTDAALSTVSGLGALIALYGRVAATHRIG